MKYYVVALFLGIATSSFGSPFFPGFYVVAAKSVNRPPEVVAEKHHVPGFNNGVADSSEVLLKKQVPKSEKKVETSLLPAVGKLAKEVFEAVIAPFKGDKPTLPKKLPENSEPKKKNIHDDRKKKTNKGKPDSLFAVAKHDADSLKLKEFQKSVAIKAKSYDKPNSLLKLEELTLPKLLKPKKPHCSTVRCKVPPKNMKCKTMKTRAEAASFADMFGIKEPVKDKWESCCPLWFCYNSGKPMFHRIIELKKDPKIVPTRRPPWFFEKYNKHNDIVPKEVAADPKPGHDLNRRPPILLSMVNPWRIQTCRADEDQQRRPPISSNGHHQVHHHHQEDSQNDQEILEVPNSAESGGFMDLVLNSLVPNPPGIFIELHAIRPRGTQQHGMDTNWHSDHHVDDGDSPDLRHKVLHLH